MQAAIKFFQSFYLISTFWDHWILQNLSQLICSISQRFLNHCQIGLSVKISFFHRTIIELLLDYWWNWWNPGLTMIKHHGTKQNERCHKTGCFLPTTLVCNEFMVLDILWIHIMSVNLTIFFIYLQKFVIKNTQFSKQNRRKQIWARMKSKRYKVIEKNDLVVSGDNFSEFIDKFCFLISH